MIKMQATSCCVYIHALLYCPVTIMSHAILVNLLHKQQMTMLIGLFYLQQTITTACLFDKVKLMNALNRSGIEFFFIHSIMYITHLYSWHGNIYMKIKIYRVIVRDCTPTTKKTRNLQI